ncbi:hypothetical protein [Pseudomonas svalbardensis]|uniref:hypothetical protein n=1 Tax=Pseudomonas svalbardensis TaxID=3042029 RepID=UPI0024B3BBD7|nr:hypothetical protein [Pseudomonas sp. PMCC200367]
MDSHRRLTSAQIHKLYQSLNASLRHSGTEILGSQLGQFVARTIAPKTIKSLGGIRSIVDSDLSDAVEFIEPRQSDFLFRIKLKAVEPLQEVIEQAAVSGAELWRYFSNPNVRCILGVDAAHRVIVTPSDQSFASDVKLLKRMDAEEYRALAQAYAQEQNDDGFRAQLLELANDSWLYAKWIECLRAKRTKSINYLKSWEIKRTELVVGRLREELELAGMEPSQATVVADGIRPAMKKKPVEEPHVFVQVAELGVNSFSEDGDAKELKDLRALLRQAVDHMSLADLKAIRVPAGVWLELLNKPMD